MNSQKTKVPDAGKFDLVKYYAITCSVLFVLVTSLMCFCFYHVSKMYIRADAEDRAVRTAQQLASKVFDERGNIPEFETEAYGHLDRDIRSYLMPLLIHKVKVYDSEMRIGYSTDLSIVIGTPDKDNRKLQLAMLGQVISDAQTKNIWDLAQETQYRGPIVETYIPIHREDGSIQGVVEIYQDVTATYARLPGLIILIVVASVLAMGTLYSVLFLLIRKADLLIHQQTTDLREAKQSLETYAEKLEIRVQERTQQLRETLLQQNQDEKMVATGTLASGVAHELNTPLSAIIGSAQMVVEHCRDESTHRGLWECAQCHEDLQRIESQAKRCSSIVKSMVDFAGKTDRARDFESLAEVVDQAIMLTQPRARMTGVDLKADFAPAPDVHVNANEVLQVLINLFGNAIDAMPGGGTITTRIRGTGQTVTLEVSDTGEGMPEETMHRIFEPFFTTKEAGQGTGLGLSISYRIVKEHGGVLVATSNPGGGTTMSMTFSTTPTDCTEGAS